MGHEVLTLATTGGRLWRAVRQPIMACLAELHGGPHECRLGGGTTLAARWRHRDSFDIDLTVSRGASLSSLGADFERMMERLGGRVEYLVGRWKIDFGTGQVDLAQLEPCPARGQRTAVVDEHFHHNVIDGERLREAARQAATTARPHELRWETGQMVPALQAADRPHRGPDLLR